MFIIIHAAVLPQIKVYISFVYDSFVTALSLKPLCVLEEVVVVHQYIVSFVALLYRFN